MHKEVKSFFLDTVPCGILSTVKRVAEFGSLDVNGSLKPYFTSPDLVYVGIDWRPGPNVDVVSLAHEYAPEQPFDFVFSTEMLEHDPHWRKSVQRMVKVTAQGGSLLITCAGPGRHEHHPETAPVEGYYGNLNLQDLFSAVFFQPDIRFERVIAEDDPVAKDVRVFFCKRF